jgi:hypothetical protein
MASEVYSLVSRSTLLSLIENEGSIDAMEAALAYVNEQFMEIIAAMGVDSQLIQNEVLIEL